MTDDTITAPTAQHRSIGFTQLSGLHRDIVILVTAIGDRGGVHLDQITDELRAWYDDERISPGSVEDELLSIESRYGFIECVGTGAFRVTIDGREFAEAYLSRVGDLWRHTNPWDNGMKLTIKHEQVGADLSDTHERQLGGDPDD